MDEQQRYSDPIDAGCARAEEWLADKIAEAQYQLGHAVSAYPAGECRNCQTKLDDGRAYCDKDCTDDFALRQMMNKRNGR